MRHVVLTWFLILGAAAVAMPELEPSPDWALRTPGGDTVLLSESLQEKPQLILLWATWCPYCKALMPHLQSISFEYGDRVGILAVNIFDDGDAAAYIDAAGYDFTVLLNGDEVAGLYDIMATPGVIIVDQQQQIRFDLRNLEYPPALFKEEQSNKVKAARMAPYWAAQIREVLDELD